MVGTYGNARRLAAASPGSMQQADLTDRSQRAGPRGDDMMEPERSGPRGAEGPTSPNRADPPVEDGSVGPASLLTFRPRQLYRRQRGRWQLQAEPSLDGDAATPQVDGCAEGGQA
jgi:hypothetical protein